MKKRFEKVVAEYVKAFCKKQDLSFEFWVADQVGTVGLFSDYYIDFSDLKLDMDTKQPKGQILEWHEILIDNPKIITNYYCYCLSKKKKQSI